MGFWLQLKWNHQRSCHLDTQVCAFITFLEDEITRKYDLTLRLWIVRACFFKFPKKKEALIRENSFMPNPLKMSICRLMCIFEAPWHILAQKNHWAPENSFLSVILTDIKHEKPLFFKKSFSFFSHQHSYGWCRCPCELPFWLIVFAVLLDSWANSTASKLKKKKGCAV